jgi:hypothetical protein
MHYRLTIRNQSHTAPLKYHGVGGGLVLVLGIPVPQIPAQSTAHVPVRLSRPQGIAAPVGRLYFSRMEANGLQYYRLSLHRNGHLVSVDRDTAANVPAAPDVTTLNYAGLHAVGGPPVQGRLSLALHRAIHHGEIVVRCSI